MEKSKSLEKYGIGIFRAITIRAITFTHFVSVLKTYTKSTDLLQEHMTCK